MDKKEILKKYRHENRLKSIDEEFIDDMIKKREKEQKDITLYVYNESTDYDLFIDSINHIVKDYRLDNFTFYVFIYSNDSYENYYGIDRTNKQYDMYDVDKTGIFSRGLVHKFKADYETFNKFLPKSNDYKIIIDRENPRILAIEYYRHLD